MRVLLAVLLAAAAARADGKVFSHRVPLVQTPDQRALLYFKDGFERLVIETAYTEDYQTKDLAWVVPLPSPPTKIEAVSRDVFRTLEAAYAPGVTDSTRSETGPVWLLAVVLVVGSALERRKMVEPTTVWAVAAVLFALMFLSEIVVPTANYASTAPVTVHQRLKLAGYDIATVSAVDSASLFEWLEAHEFKVAAQSRGVMEEYLREGWTFAVIRLGFESRGWYRRPPPLSFEFGTDEPVFPMKLTGVGNEGCELSLFVFSDRQAHTHLLDTLYSRRVVRGKGGSWRYHQQTRGDPVPVVHDGLLGLIGDATVVTRFFGTLDADDMREDLTLGWRDYSPVERKLYTKRAVRSAAFRTGVWTAFGVLLISGLVAAARGRTGFGQSAIAALLVGVSFGLAHYLVVEKVEAAPGGPGDYPHFVHFDVVELVDRMKLTNVEDARKLAEVTWTGRTNPYTGGPVTESASPGNYQIRMRDGLAVYVHFDAFGGEWRRLVER